MSIARPTARSSTSSMNPRAARAALVGPVPGGKNGWGFVDTSATHPELISEKWMVWMETSWESRSGSTSAGSRAAHVVHVNGRG